MKKVVSPCFCKVYTRSGNEATARAFCKIQFENGRLSITGVIGPLRSGGHCGSAGQCVDEIREGCPAMNGREKCSTSSAPSGMSGI